MRKKCQEIILLILTILLIFTNISNAEDNSAIKQNIVDISDEASKTLKATKIGIGGGGALFFPAISPHNPNEMYVISDMGGIYISHNKGQDWNRENLYGTVYSGAYDPNREGTIYAGGSGLYRSTDNGDSFELVFPRKDDIIARLIRGDYGMQYYFTHSKVYDQYKTIKSILVNPEDSNNIFIMSYSEQEGIVYESTDNCESFKEIFRFNTSKAFSVYTHLNELFYRRETKDLFLINDEEIIKYNLESKEKSSVYKTNTSIVDAETVYENNKTYFIIIEKTNELDNSTAKIYYTDDFVNKTDITSNFTSTAPTSFYDEYNGCGMVTYKYNFKFVVASSLNNIYVAHATEEETTEQGEYWSVTGIIRYHDNVSEYLYGTPFKDQSTLQTRLWDDYNTEAYGLAISKQDEEEFLMTTLMRFACCRR